MSNIEFELISPDWLKETYQTDWWLCFIWQIEKKRKAAESIMRQNLTKFP